MLGFCLHNYRYSQGKFRCSKCGHTTYGADTTYEFKDDEESYVKPLSNRSKIAGFLIVLVLILGTTHWILTDENIWRDTLYDQYSRDPENTANIIEAHIARITNEFRDDNGMPALKMNDKISDVVRGHSFDMMTRECMEHETPEGLDPTARTAIRGLTCHKDYGSYYTEGFGENIAQDWILDIDSPYTGLSKEWYTAEEMALSLMVLWANSPGHRENLLESAYTEIGVGIAIGKNRSIYATQNFC